MDFDIEELLFLNKHLDYLTAVKLQKWLKYNITNHANLSDVEIKDSISNAIMADENTFNPNKGTLLAYLKHSIVMELIKYSMKNANMPKHELIALSEQDEETWIDLSYFSDDEIQLLYQALIKEQVDYKHVKEIIDEYSKQITKGKQSI